MERATPWPVRMMADADGPASLDLAELFAAHYGELVRLAAFLLRNAAHAEDMVKRRSLRSRVPRAGCGTLTEPSATCAAAWSTHVDRPIVTMRWR